MTRRSIVELSAILLPGGVAAVVVARVLPLYWGSDWPASVIVLAIACALGMGLVELVARQLRVRQLERELSALPATPRETTLDLASPQLSALLRARLERAPNPPGSEGIAPFLSGLLVMLGLLGTLLGLFQTVQGAGQALTGSSDVDALRQGLRTPIAGLTRSFGCSAAGISASAMLGLALALVRRRETRMLRAVHAYAAGPLRALSLDVRQTRALEQLVSQNTSLPAAVGAFEQVANKLGELSGQLLSQQKAALASMHDEFAKAAVETGRALHAHISPPLEQLAARSGEALAAQSTALAKVARDVTREIERDAQQRRDEAARALEAMRTRLDAAEGARAAAHARELAALTGVHERTLTDSERRWQELLTRLDLQLVAAGEREREQLEQLESLRTRVGSELERLSAQLSEQLERRLASERDHDLRAERTAAQVAAASAALEQASAGQQAALARVDQSAELFDGAIAQQGRGLEALIERVGALLPELAEAAQSGAVQTLDRLRELGEEQAARLTQLDSSLAHERAGHARELAAQLTNHASELEQRLGKTSEAVQDASAIWQASSAEMQAVAQLFASSVDRQREASEAWLESLGDVEAAVERAGRHAASDALSDQLASTQELFTRQLQFQRELLEQLRALRGGTGNRFANGERDVSTRE